MTNANPDEVLVAESDGVTVEKSFEPDDFPVPAIAFALYSERDKPASVRLVDTVPEDVSPENIGFHPKYGAEFWDVSGDEIVFERELAPGEEYTTVYGLRGDDSDVPSKFLSDPRIESVTPPLGDAAGGDTGDDPEMHSNADVHIDDTEPVVDDVETDTDGVESETNDSDTRGDTAESDADEVASDTEADTGTGIDSEADPDDEADSGPTSDTGVNTVSIDTEDGRDESVTSPPDAGRSGDDSLVGALIEEIEDADPDDPEIVALRDALGIDLTRAAVEARIDHLQSAVSDLEAYTGALEAFLDENGDAQRVLDDVREQYEETTARLDAIETTAEDAADSVESIESQVDSELDEVRSEMDGLEAELESLSEELSDVVEMRERLAQALGGIAGESSSERDYE